MQAQTPRYPIYENSVGHSDFNRQAQAFRAPRSMRELCGLTAMLWNAVVWTKNESLPLYGVGVGD